MGKASVVELPSHQPLLVDPLIEGRRGFEQQGTDAHRPINGFHSGILPECVLKARPIGVKYRIRREEGHSRPLCQPVKIQISSPEVFPILCFPAEGTASPVEG